MAWGGGQLSQQVVENPLLILWQRIYEETNLMGLIFVPFFVVYGVATGRLVNSLDMNGHFGAVHLAVEQLDHGSTALVDRLVERNSSRFTHKAHAGDQNGHSAVCHLACIQVGAEDVVQRFQDVFARGQLGSREVSKADEDGHLVSFDFSLR